MIDADTLRSLTERIGKQYRASLDTHLRATARVLAELPERFDERAAWALLEHAAIEGVMAEWDRGEALRIARGAP